MTMERRALASPLLVRAETRTIGGYAAVFNSETMIGDFFREMIAPGAFAETIKGDVRALFDHDSGVVLGRTKAGTLRLSEDDKGLNVEIDLPDTQAARDLVASMERGDIDGMSFGFRVLRQEWDESSDVALRIIREVELFEVSVVTFPAYDDTEVALRSLDEARKARRAHNFSAAARRAQMKTAIALRKRQGEHPA
jgi:HK97 family phage prohead protease